MKNLILLVLLALQGLASALHAQTLTLRVNDIPKPEGQLYVAFYVSEADFLKKPLTGFRVAVTDTMLVAVADTIRLSDTVYLRLSRETKQYKDSLFRAQVSGYRPSLDWVEVYPQTVVVTKIISADSRKRWGIGVQAGYGAYFDGGDVSLSPYVGIGISWNILTW